jgi:hypothetical protein
VPDCVDYKVGRIEPGDAVSGLKKNLELVSLLLDT